MEKFYSDVESSGSEAFKSGAESAAEPFVTTGTQTRGPARVFGPARAPPEEAAAFTGTHDAPRTNPFDVLNANDMVSTEVSNLPRTSLPRSNAVRFLNEEGGITVEYGNEKNRYIHIVKQLSQPSSDPYEMAELITKIFFDPELYSLKPYMHFPYRVLMHLKFGLETTNQVEPIYRSAKGVNVPSWEEDDEKWSEEMKEATLKEIAAFWDKSRDEYEAYDFADRVSITLFWKGKMRPRFIPDQPEAPAGPSTTDALMLDVGCAPKGASETFARGNYLFWSPKTGKDTCLVDCVIHSLRLHASTSNKEGNFTYDGEQPMRIEAIRKRFITNEFIRDQYLVQFPFPVKEAWRLADYFNVRIKLYYWDLDFGNLCEYTRELSGELIRENASVPLEFAPRENGDDPSLRLIKIMIEKDHAYLVYKENFPTMKKVCHNCKREMLDEANHKCHASNINFLNRMANRKDINQVVAVEKFVTHINNKWVVFFDFEAFTDFRGHHTVYACGWSWFEQPPGAPKRKHDQEDPGKWVNERSWGMKALEEFWDRIKELHEHFGKKITLVGFNNSRYDNLLLLRFLVDKGVKVKDMKIQNSAIISLETECFKMFDLCRLMAPGKLEDAAIGFGASKEDCKSYFPHKFIKDWKDLRYVGPEPEHTYENYFELPPKESLRKTEGWILKKVCLQYLDQDINATRFVFLKLQDAVFESMGVNITEFMTASHMAYEIWTNLVADAPKETGRRNPLKEHKELFHLPFPTLDQEKFIRQSIYGGRTYNTRRSYESIYYEVVMQAERERLTKKEKLKEELAEKLPFVTNPEDRKKIVLEYEKAMENRDNFPNYDMIQGWLEGMDTVSLYAAAMRNRYPIGEMKEMTNEDILLVETLLSTGNFDAIKPCIVKAKYITNKHLVIPALPRKEFRTREDGTIISLGLKWDLYDSEGVYTIVDIIQAIKQGYLFKIESGWMWDGWGLVFRKYIDLALAIKLQGDEQKNEALRSVGKLLCNGLYGKMLQRPIFDATEMIETSKQMDKFLKEHVLKDVILLHDEERRFVASGTVVDKESKIKKPSYLGAFVLSYSRQIMHDFAGRMDPFRGDPEKLHQSFQRSFYYTDTDSYFFEYSKEVEKALKPVTSEKPGDFWFDLKDKVKGRNKHGKILKAYFCGPKTYALMYYTGDHKVEVKMKAKGMPAKYLAWKDYEDLLKEGIFETKTIEQTIKKVMQSRGEQTFSTVVSMNVKKCLMKGKIHLTNSNACVRGLERSKILWKSLFFTFWIRLFWRNSRGR